MRKLPIGLFDSGVGGLTVLKAVADLLPHENLLYLGDTARVPYGTKSRDTILRYTLNTTHKLVDRGVKMLIIACNTATSAALPIVREKYSPIPVIGVIEPGARAACTSTRSGRIAVIATEATIAQGAYQQAIRNINPEARIIPRACTLLVSLAEEGWLEGEPAVSTIRRYLGDIFSSERSATAPDTLLLGCTHFPLFRNALQKILGDHVTIVDSAAATAQAAKALMAEKGILNADAAPGSQHFYTTDNPDRFARTGSLFLGRRVTPAEVELVEL